MHFGCQRRDIRDSIPWDVGGCGRGRECAGRSYARLIAGLGVKSAFVKNNGREGADGGGV